MGVWPEIQPDVAVVASIKNVDELLRRSGLEFRKLLDLLQVQYISSGNSLTIDSTDADHPDTCDTGKLELHELNADAASRIVRFVRLWRKLGWSMVDLDRAISVFGGLQAGLLVQLSHVKRLGASLNLPVEQVLTLWAKFDTGEQT